MVPAARKDDVSKAGWVATSQENDENLPDDITACRLGGCESTRIRI